MSDSNTTIELGQSIFRQHFIILSFACAKLFIHLSVNLFGGYGYIRDELYYLACSDHLAWGYVDHPPLSIAALWISRLFFGDSLFALRLLPAVSGTVVVVLTGLITKQIGGSKYAQALACSCAVAAPLLLGMDSVFSMNSFEVLFWTGAVFLIILCVVKGDVQYWAYLGLTLGLGLLNKISVLWLGAGIMIGLALVPERRLFLTRKPWIAAFIALIVFLPYVFWQIASGFPTLEFIRNAASGKYFALSPLDLCIQQSIFMNPLTLPIWLGGLVYIMFSKSAKRFRILPIIYLVVFIILVVNKNSKATYLAPLLPMLFSLGALATERLLSGPGLRSLRVALVCLVLTSGIALAPFVLAVLPVDTYVSYANAFGVAPASSERNQLGILPQHFADMFGWPEMVTVVADAYNTLSPQDKAKCSILCNNYGEAGAIDFFGRKYGLPKALCGHNNYWLWGPGSATGEIVIRLGGSPEILHGSYVEAVKAGTIRNHYSMPYESDLPVWICRNRRMPLKDDWSQFKHFN